MGDFDMSQALDSPLDSDGKGLESFSFALTDVQDEIIKVEARQGLRFPMKGAATLVLAANRMKKLQPQKGQSDSGCCRVSMHSVIESTTVQRVEDCSRGQRRLVFQRLRSWECSLTDQDKKDIVCVDKDLKLMALTLNAANCDHKAKFKMGTYGSPGVGQTVVLSIINHNLYISCTMNDDKAELKLEECSAKDLKVICKDGSKDRFLFYVKEIEMNVKTFESVMCRGWFISTSYEQEAKPLEMCKVDSASRITSFCTS